RDVLVPRAGQFRPQPHHLFLFWDLDHRLAEWAARVFAPRPGAHRGAQRSDGGVVRVHPRDPAQEAQVRRGADSGHLHRLFAGQGPEQLERLQHHLPAVPATDLGGLVAIKILTLAFALFGLSRAVLRWRRGAGLFFELVFWALLWSGVGVVVFVPHYTDRAAHWMGVS